ncbi:unnamed protein product [Brachionus calyciflorus]|uniref:EamA domain-containing protein n=1 Tax=Brachionus calyciflorus TaxID=104777 RepID=A0A814G1I7_9BILA|nr:unnamed protein product [Brachionus calyciflorus]
MDKNPLLINKNKIKNVSYRHMGFIYALLSAFFFALSGTITKYCYYFNGSEQTAIRYLIQLVIMLIIGVYRGENLLGENGQRKILFFRACFGTTGLLFITISYKMIDPSDTVSLVNCSIIIVSVLSRLVFKEKYSMCHLVALSLTSIGVVLISQPSFLINKKIDKNEDYMKRILGIIFALIGAFCTATVSILLKKLANQKVHYCVAIIYASYLGLPVCSIISFYLLFIGKERKSYIDFKSLLFQCALAFLSGLSGLLAQIFKNVAFNYEDVTKVSLIKSTDLFFSFFLQFFMLNIHPNMFNLIGALLILGSALIVIIKKILESKFFY